MNARIYKININNHSAPHPIDRRHMFEILGIRGYRLPGVDWEFRGASRPITGATGLPPPREPENKQEDMAQVKDQECKSD